MKMDQRLLVKRFSLIGVVVLMWAIFMGRLIFLQVVEYEIYSPISEKNSLRQIPVTAPRGLIYDRNGTILVENEPIFTITVTPINFDTSKIGLLSSLLNVPEQEIREGVTAAKRYSWHRPSRLVKEVDFDRFSLIEENSWQLPGIGYQIEAKRNYPSGILAAHTLGYLREASLQEINADPQLRPGDKVGKSGIETTYEKVLRGSPGLEMVRVNALGQSLSTFDQGNASLLPRQGADLIVTLDAKLQGFLEQLMVGKNGAAVAMNPKSGEILALVSAPQFDVSELAGRLNQTYWTEINRDSLTPLFNRVISSRQPPGSTVKPLMGIIGQQMNLIDPYKMMYNPGVYVRGRSYRDLAPPGDYDLKKSIQFSSNTYYFAMMDEIATSRRLNEWAGYMRDFGLGVRTGVDLPAETQGIVPDSLIMNRTFGVRRWGIGDLINLGVGQGVFSVSPLQLARAISVIANGGYRVEPHVVKFVRVNESQWQNQTPDPVKIEWLKPEYLTPVVEGMQAVVEQGNARYLLRIPDIAMAGKTGTAQNPTGQDHGWFTAFAPVEDPQIVVAVLMENGGFGSLSAGPVGTLMVEYYLKGEISRPHVLEHLRTYVPPPVKPTEVE